MRHIESLPAWGVWIEINLCRAGMLSAGSLPAWGVWIEIFEIPRESISQSLRRSPHGECGLKYTSSLCLWAARRVAPRMGSVD